MANETYQLNNTAVEVESAIGSVINSTVTEPNKILEQGSNHLATHSSVYTALGNFNNKVVTTEATGIENTDNDTSIPTSAAVVDYVATQSPPTKYATFTAADASYTYGDQWLAFVINQDPYNIATVSGGIIRPTEAGLYAFSWSGLFSEKTSFGNGSYTVETRFESAAVDKVTLDSITNLPIGGNHIALITNLNSDTGVYAELNSRAYWSNVKATLVKLN